MPPRFVLATPSFGRPAGGVGASADRIARLLAADFEPVVLVPDPCLPVTTYEEQGVDPLGRLLVRFWWKPRSALAGQFLADLVGQYLRAGGWGAAFCAGELAFPVVHAARLAGVRSAVFGRGNDVDLDLFADTAFPVYHALAHADAVFVVSREMAAKAQAFAPGAKTVFVANGVDPEVFRPGTAAAPGERARLAVGLFGEVKHKKGLDLLLEAMDFSRFELHIFGRLQPEASRYLHGFLTFCPEAAAGVHVHGYSHDLSELVERYRACHAVVVPSVHDGMPNVLLEAMACGSLCIASAVGGALDVVEHGRNGLLFESRSPRGLAAALDEAEAFLRRENQDLQSGARETVTSRFTEAHEQRAYLDYLGATESRGSEGSGERGDPATRPQPPSGRCGQR